MNIVHISCKLPHLQEFRSCKRSILGLFSRLIMTPEELPQLLKTIEQGWMMGLKAKPLFAQKWEEAWEKPLSLWQAELNI